MKKKLNRRLQQLIALVLIAAMLWQTDSMRFFSTAYAAEIEGVVTEETDVTLQEETLTEEEQVPVTVLGEVEELRTEDEKHFRMSDGSFMAVSFGMPMHYQDAEGQWQEIDNRMVLSDDRSSYGTYNIQSTTNFATSLGNGILFETSYGDTSVSMSLLDTASANLLMNIISIPITPPITEMEIVPQQSTTVLSSNAVSVVGQEVQIQALNQEILTEMIDSDLLVFDRMAIADTTVEGFDVINESGNLSDIDDTKDGWTMEDILPENFQDSLLYADVFPGVDLLYTKYSHNVKEQIIVNEPQASYRYDFKLTLEGVEAVLNDDGSVSLVKEDSENEIYHIPAPFMEDANGVLSYDVNYGIVTLSDGIILTVVADKEWMNATERVFPVAIDPTIIIRAGEESEEVYFAYTAQGAPNVDFEGLHSYVGYTTWNSRKEYRSFLYFNKLPDVPSGMTVVDAQLHLYMDNYSYVGCNELALGIYEVTSSRPSTVSNYYNWIYDMTWNTMPTYNTGNMIDYVFVSNSTVNKYLYWDITELAKKWYIEDTDNRTVALTQVPGNYGSTYYGEARFYAWGTIAPPVIAVSYRSSVGIEPYYTYQTIGVGNAGTAYIADATGQLKVVKPVVSYASTINPFSLSLVYNSDYFAEDNDLDYQPPIQMGQKNVAEGITQGNIAMKLGQGWNLDIIQTMHIEKINNIQYLCYTDGDGTKHYFAVDDERNGADGSDKTFYYDEDGLGLKAEITNETKTSFTMYDDKGNKWIFTNGRLTSISDETANSYYIGWNNANRITQISQVNRTMPPIRVAIFTYSGDYISSITDAAGDIYSFTYSSGKLRNIYRNGDNYCYYDYLSNSNQLYRMVDDEKTYEIEFGISHGRISAYREFSQQEIGDAVYISYPNYSKTVYRTIGMNHIKGDADDLLTCYLFDYSGRTINAYTTDVNNNVLGATNVAYLDTEVTRTETSAGSVTTTVSKKANRTEKIGSTGVSNPTLFHYGACENAGWTLLANTGGMRSASYDTEEHRTGAYSLKMVSQITGGAYYASADSLSLSVGDTYTASAYVKTSDCTSINMEGITLEVKDAAGNWFYGKGLSYITSENIDNGWTRIHVTFTALHSGVHTIYIYAEETVGTFYVDDVQLEQGNAPGVLNLLKNGSMETNPSGWNGFNGAGYSVGTGWNDSQSMRITGDPVKEAYIRQDVSINLPATETFVLSGWAKANSVPDNVNKHEDPLQDIDKQYGLRARVLYTDGTKEYHYTPFNPDVSEWQFASLTIVPKCPEKTIDTIRVICTFEGNANAAYFDNICLSREAAQTLKYNDDGELESVTTPGLDTDKNMYQGGNLMSTQTGGNGTYRYTYDTTFAHRLTAVTDGIVTQTIGYDATGNVSTSTLKSNKTTESSQITTSATYTNLGNLLASVTDAAGNTVQYLYDNARDKMYGLPSVVVDGNGNRKETYYDKQGRVTEEYTSDCVEVWYYYNNGNLTEIEKENISATQFYEMLYDAYGNMTGFNIGDRNIATYSYGDRNGYLTKLTYGNQKSVQYTYDLLGRVIQETFSDGRIVDYVYNCNGQLYSATDSVSGTVYYTYDSLGRLIYAEDEGRGIRFQYQYNTNNQMTGLDICVDGWNSVSEEFYYNGKTPAEKIDGISDGTLTSMQMVTGDMIERSVDALQRLEHRIIAEDYQENYFYSPGSGANTTTVRISEKQDVLDGTIINDLQYTYDGVGNITRIYNVVSGEAVEYFYDELNQLTSASYSDGKVENYTYDIVGNLLTFNNGIASHTYTYGDSDWIDLLTAVDGVSLTYDEIGNPLSYYNGSSYTMTWTEGRKLASVTTEDGTTSYLYNAEGLRFKKINPDGSYILYLATDGVIIGEKHYTSSNVLTKNMRYTFDENGTVCGYSTSTDGNTWTDYYFIRNLQGDVLQVYRESDNVVVAEYSYDSWGNILSAEKELAEENPFRYRGYYYDAETGFYYVSSRYYDPEIGRWINADNYVSTGQGILGYNMFSYCMNNPINRLDRTGTRSMLVTNAYYKDGGCGTNTKYLKAFYGVDSSEDIPELPDDAMIFVENISSFSILGGLCIVEGRTIVMDEYKYCEYVFVGVGYSISKSMAYDKTITQGYVYGIENVDDYCGFFMGGSANMLSTAAGGAYASPKVYAEITNGIGFAPSLGGSITWYMTAQSDWIYGPANMEIIVNPYEGSLIN